MPPQVRAQGAVPRVRAAGVLLGHRVVELLVNQVTFRPRVGIVGMIIDQASTLHEHRAEIDS